MRDMDERDIAHCRTISCIVNLAKQSLGITVQNDEMSDEDIRKIGRWVGEHGPDTVWVNNWGGESMLHEMGIRTILGRIAIETMLFVTLMAFPRFYEEHELSQYN